MNQTIEAQQETLETVGVATEGPEENGGGTARQAYINTLTARDQGGNEIENLNHNHNQNENEKQEQKQEEKEIPASSSTNKLEGGTETKSHEHIKPEKPAGAESQDSSRKLRHSRTLKSKTSHTDHITVDAAKERASKRRSFTNIGGSPLIVTNSSKSQYSKSNRTGRNATETENNENDSKAKSARSVEKSHALEESSGRDSKENDEAEGSEQNVEVESPENAENEADAN